MPTSRYRKTAGVVSAITYHLVWCVKYRKPFLTGKVATRLRELIVAKAKEIECEIIALEIMPDHVHLLVSSLPVNAPQFLANQFKGNTSRLLRQEFSFLRTKLPALWTRSYYVGSAGAMSADTIQKYIEEQKGRNE
jgi:putative transposase